MVECERGRGGGARGREGEGGGGEWTKKMFRINGEAESNKRNFLTYLIRHHE